MVDRERKKKWLALGREDTEAINLDKVFDSRSLLSMTRVEGLTERAVRSCEAFDAVALTVIGRSAKPSA